MKKNILITGASSGLGAGMAKRFAAKGCDLALCARRLDELQALKQELETAHPGCRVFVRQLDVADYGQVFDVFEAFRKDLGTIDRFVINAGIGKGVPIGKGGFKANLETAQINFCSALAQCEAAVSILREQNAGHLVTISSMSAIRGFRGALSCYAATKAGLANLTEGIRLELLDTPIKVTTLFPGYILTDINRDIRNAPFRVDLDKGCDALLKAIEREPDEACVPSWPWTAMRSVLSRLPLSALKKFS